MPEITAEEAVTAMRTAHELAEYKAELHAELRHNERQKEAYNALQAAYARVKEERDRFRKDFVDLDQRHDADLDATIERDKVAVEVINRLIRENTEQRSRIYELEDKMGIKRDR